MEKYSVSINERVEQIKNDNSEIEKLIEEYKPFIASVVQGATGRFVKYGEDDELSIALIAFEESIKSYDASKGNFLAFSRNVIKRRLIDFFRKESRHNREIPLMENVSSDGDDDEDIDMSMQESVKLFNETQIAEFRRMEIEELKNELKKWDISYYDVAKSSPKQEGTRKIYLEVVNFITDSKDLLDSMKKKRYLPIAEIEKSLKIPRKKIERGRNYIVAAVLIKAGDYEYLKSFIEWR